MNIYHKESIKKYLAQVQLEPQLGETTTEREELLQEGWNNAVLALQEIREGILKSLEEPGEQVPHHNHD